MHGKEDLILPVSIDVMRKAGPQLNRSDSHVNMVTVGIFDGLQAHAQAISQSNQDGQSSERQWGTIVCRMHFTNNMVGKALEPLPFQ